MCPQDEQPDTAARAPRMVNGTSHAEPVEYSVHTSLCFDPKQMKWLNNITFAVNTESGLIVKMDQRSSEHANVAAGDKDLRGKVVLPGLVDAHTHIFLHAYA